MRKPLTYRLSRPCSAAGGFLYSRPARGLALYEIHGGPTITHGRKARRPTHVHQVSVDAGRTVHRGCDRDRSSTDPNPPVTSRQFRGPGRLVESGGQRRRRQLGQRQLQVARPNGVVRASGESVVPPSPQPLNQAAQPLAAPVVPATAQTPIARVTKGPDSLPADAGQEWRDYDISPYTARVTSTNRPEQAILDWILRETGYEAWHTGPLAFLNIDNRRLRVFHTPEMHAVVSDLVDRFVNTEAESHAFGMRVITLGSPNWRSKAHRMLHPVNTQTQGVQAWLLAKEDLALLSADLRKRSDFQEHSTPHLMVNNGQSAQVPAMRARNYVRDLLLKSDAWGGYRAADGAVRRRLQARV